MNRRMIWGGAAAVAGLLGYLALAPTSPDDAGRAALPALDEVSVPDDLPAEARIGQRFFEAKCAECHGENAAGRIGVGPESTDRDACCAPWEPPEGLTGDIRPSRSNVHPVVQP